MALIGIILLMGIVKKNAIMMIDFATAAERDEGLSPFDAIERACRLRFRPIMMTTLAALFGAIPLALAHGSGAELRVPLGITIIGGLLLSQLLTLYTTPVIYLQMEALGRRFGLGTAPIPDVEAEAAPEIQAGMRPHRVSQRRCDAADAVRQSARHLEGDDDRSYLSAQRRDGLARTAVRGLLVHEHSANSGARGTSSAELVAESCEAGGERDHLAEVTPIAETKDRRKPTSRRRSRRSAPRRRQHSPDNDRGDPALGETKAAVDGLSSSMPRSRLPGCLADETELAAADLVLRTAGCRQLATSPALFWHEVRSVLLVRNVAGG